MKKSLLDLAKEIQATSKNGIEFSENPFDIERFKHLEDIAIEIMERHTNLSAEHISEVLAPQRGYVTPKLDVRAAVFDDERLLLVKEKSTDKWTLPGGYVDVGDSLSAAAEKEVVEESGFLAKTTKIAAIFDHRKHGYKPHLYHFIKTYVICDLIGGSKQGNHETTDASFFTESEIKAMELDPGRVTNNHVLKMFEHRRKPELPTDFD